MFKWANLTSRRSLGQSFCWGPRRHRYLLSLTLCFLFVLCALCAGMTSKGCTVQDIFPYVVLFLLKWFDSSPSVHRISVFQNICILELSDPKNILLRWNKHSKNTVVEPVKKTKQQTKLAYNQKWHIYVHIEANKKLFIIIPSISSLLFSYDPNQRLLSLVMGMFCFEGYFLHSYQQVKSLLCSKQVNKKKVCALVVDWPTIHPFTSRWVYIKVALMHALQF